MIQSITRLFSKKSPQRPPSAGIYHYAYAHPVGESHVHLRVEADGSGFMLVNANRIFHMNPTALFMAYLKLEGCSPEQILTTFTRAYDVDPASAQDDYARFEDTFHALVEETGKCPLCDLHLETLPPMSCIPSAPYRMDLAITYRCNNNCSHCYNARSRNFPELSTIQWKQVIDQLWAIGIPHIVFTGGEPTLREDLPELIQYAQSRGQITGINTNGRRLKDPVFLQQLVDAGLDHVQITFESH
ncbi:MAG: radical SAM protein, partial [Anaerolineaceae bacterium]|nr:radical SAM protein [Anaerolineaceae bacterium]